jgi:hypothetical protein
MNANGIRNRITRLLAATSPPPAPPPAADRADYRIDAATWLAFRADLQAAGLADADCGPPPELPPELLEEFRRLNREAGLLGGEDDP